MSVLHTLSARSSDTPYSQIMFPSQTIVCSMFILCTFPPHLFRNIMYLATNAKSTFFCKVFYSIISLYKRCMLCYRAHLLLPAPSVQLFPSFVGEAHNELNWNLPFHFFFTFLSTTHTHKFFSCHSCHTALKKKALSFATASCPFATV